MGNCIIAIPEEEKENLYICPEEVTESASCLFCDESLLDFTIIVNEAKRNDNTGKEVIIYQLKGKDKRVDAILQVWLKENYGEDLLGFILS